LGENKTLFLVIERRSELKKLLVVFLAIGLLFVMALNSVSVSASDEDLILNGDFEANDDPFFPDVPPNRWNVFQTHALGGWTVANTFPFSANFLPGLEIWDTLSGYPAANGTQHLELDGNDPTTILQTPATTEGNCYELSYAWSPRPDWEDNQIKVYVDGVEAAYHSATGLDNLTTQWTWETLYFRAANLWTTVAFAEVGIDDQLGMLLDAVSLKECALIYVDIDIKSESDPNSINLKSKGKISVAILTTEYFDAYNVDPDTVNFAGANPLRWRMEDVDNDGDYDMMFHFKTQELDLTKESTEATLEGETIDEVQIKGTDSVNIVPKGKGYDKEGKNKKKK
jgi:hypothetical protein